MRPPDAASCDATITPALIRTELERVLQSSEFAHKPQLQRFLNFIVEEELAGRGTQLKEYVLAVGVFGRPADFDPRLDSLVRVEARRLRMALAKYYREEGHTDPLSIELEKGSYLPSFRVNQSTGVDCELNNHLNICTSKDIPLIPAPKRWLAIAAVILAALSVAACIFAFLQLRRPNRLSNRDLIVLTDFTNSTSDPVFDETLKQGLTMALEQSPFLAILSDQQSGQVLKLMGRSPSLHLNDELAREVCLRSGSKAIVKGSINRLDSHFVIGLTATNCANGEAIVHLQTEAKKKESVLIALASAAAGMRRKLGESLSSIQHFDVPLDEVTTPSLEALQAFGMGRRIAREKGSPADIPYYKLAIELDPNFAVAYAALGVSYVNQGEPGIGANFIRKGYELRERTSEHERLRISSYYFHVVTGESDKAIETYELWKQNYPRDFAPYINLGLEFTWTGQYEKCAEETRQALNLEPDNVLPYSNLIASYIKLGRTQEAGAILRQAEARNLSGKFLRSNAYILAFLRGDEESMARQLADAKGRPGEEDALLALQSDTEAHYGRLKNAREFSRQAIDSAKRARAIEAAAGFLINSALREAEFGNPAGAQREVAEALHSSNGRDVRVLAALALARSNDLDGANRLARQLEHEFPTNTLIRAYWLPVIRAAIELRRHNPDRAIELLQITSPFELGSPPPIGVATLYPIYLRGEAFLQNGRFDSAEREFKKIVDQPNLVLNYPLHALAWRQFGRAQAHLHNQAGALASYRRFLDLWKSADLDIPILQQAKDERARLQ